MKKIVLAILALVLFATTAFAADQYHVYRKNGRCEIDTRTHDKFKNARGSGWTCIGHANYRMDAEKIFKKAGCRK